MKVTCLTFSPSLPMWPLAINEIPAPLIAASSVSFALTMLYLFTSLPVISSARSKTLPSASIELILKSLLALEIFTKDSFAPAVPT